MFVGILSQVRLQPLGQVAPENLEQVLKQGFTGSDKEGEYGQYGDLFLGGFKTQASHKALFLVDDHINGNAYQDFRGNIEQFIDDGAGGGGDDLPAISPGVSEQAGEGSKTAGGFVAV